MSQGDAERGPLRRTRLAPSPTGALHLGNARTFLINWVIARQRGWQIVLRIDDLDGPRVKQDAARQAIEDLHWLGIDWDEGPYYQTAELSVYAQTLQELGERGLIYPCRCTRKEIEAAALSAPHFDQHELRYPGTCRPPSDRPNPRFETFAEGVAWRIRVAEGEISFADHVCGDQSNDVQRTVGDFLVATKQQVPSYQLAVVVDDNRQGITDVVRGDDLIRSTARQILLYQQLGTAVPDYWHLPLVLGPDGRRLAKRHGDTRVRSFRESGVPVERVIGLIAGWSGLPQTPLSAAEFKDAFRLGQLPRQMATFRDEDRLWLEQPRG